MKKLISTFLFLSSISLWASDITVEDQKIRLVPPTSSVSAMFLKIKNNSDKDIKLISAESNISKAVELHDMIMENGSMKMRRVDNISLKAKSSTELKRGGLHIMFINLNAPLKDGNTHKIKFTFDNKTSLEVEAKVQPID
jgi:copper(I)-binding protein